MGKYKTFAKLAKSRRTTYDFSSKKVTDAQLNKILEAGRWAPSCSNTQPWRFIVVKDPERISKLVDSSSYGGFYSDPSLLIAIILDAECWEGGNHRCVKNSKLGTFEAYLSVAMPAQNMVLQAEDLGLSTCMLTPVQKEASKILKMKIKDAVPLVIGVGYEKKGAYRKKRDRMSLKKLVYYEIFGNRKRRK